MMRKAVGGNCVCCRLEFVLTVPVKGHLLFMPNMLFYFGHIINVPSLLMQFVKYLGVYGKYTMLSILTECLNA